jgi:hypothetical protein
MNRRLRSAHRAIWLVALIALPVIIVSGLEARRAVPLVAALPGPRGEALTAATRWWTGAGAFTVTPVRVEGDSAVAIEVRNSSSPGAPDLLLYWTRKQESAGAIDSGDVLLGSAKGTASSLFRLPAEARGGESALLLYSLAQRQLLGRLPLTDGRPHTP